METRFDTEAKGYSEIDKSNTRTQDVKSFLKNTYTLKRMAIKIHCSSLFTCRPLGLGSFPTVFFARILVLSPRTPSPVFVLFIFRFVIWLVMTPRCVSWLSRRTISEKKGITVKLTTWLHWADQPDQSQTKIKQGTNKNHATGAKRGNTLRIQIDTIETQVWDF